ncbi:MAG TPA: glycosyltransferase [Gemmataceae bacterium]|jgi:hypothetical protein|nr:glycosyltransferase [Gemmataceae bacterium]
MKLLVIRGDLQAHSGYSAAIRAYCKILQSFFDRVIGVDIHFAKERPFESFPYTLVSEAEARYEAAKADATLALSITTPNHYVRLPNATNIGLTFWETDQWPTGGQPRSPWIRHANQMDALWSASTFSKNAFKEMGVRVPIRVIPWPVETPGTVPAGLPDGEVYDLDRCLTSTESLAWMGNLQARWFRPSRWVANKLAQGGANRFLSHLLTNPRKIPGTGQKSFLCVAQDVPRKGLLLFLSEWMEFKRSSEGQSWNLILKSTPYNPEVPRFQFVSRFWQHIQALKDQLQVAQADVFLWASDLESADFNRLVGNTFASVCPSFGEGFCGPAALALSLKKPLIAPRHTAFCDYLSTDYPYLYPSRSVRAQFVDDAVGLYAPYSTWNVPEPAALAASLLKVVREEPSRLTAVAGEARDYLDRWCRPGRVRRLLAGELEWIADKTGQVRVAS